VFAKLLKASNSFGRFVRLFILSYGTTWLPLDGFELNFILERSLGSVNEIQIYSDLDKKYQVRCMKI